MSIRYKRALVRASVVAGLAAPDRTCAEWADGTGEWTNGTHVNFNSLNRIVDGGPHVKLDMFTVEDLLINTP